MLRAMFSNRLHGPKCLTRMYCLYKGPEYLVRVYFLYLFANSQTIFSVLRRVYRYRTYFWRAYQLTEVWGTGIEFVPNHTGVFGKVGR